jgi:fumarylacetoacetase
MTLPVDFSHDPERVSWVESAADDLDFPLQNLPFGVFSTPDDRAHRIGVAIGDLILDLDLAAQAGLVPDGVRPACGETTLNALLALGPSEWRKLRAGLSELLGADTCPAGERREKVARCLVSRASATMHLPAKIGGYTDFYASIHHAANAGRLFRPDNPLLPNYKWVPIAYHGRTSTIFPSGTPIHRPRGQAGPREGPPEFGPSRQLDYELEAGLLVGPGNPPGAPIPIANAGSHLFGIVLLNDWSARDLQSWEYQPLGPFLAKNFATTISPWVVTMEALAPFRAPAAPRPAGDPAPLPHLADSADAATGAIAVKLEVWLLSEKMRQTGNGPVRLGSSALDSLYWTPAQMVAHHTSNGCNLEPGDLLGSGTVSGPAPDSRGCLLELTARGTQPVTLPGGETRSFLVDGDEVILRGWADRPGARRIGLGECRGIVLPANRCGWG